MDTELQKLQRQCLAKPDDFALAERYERAWVRAHAASLEHSVVDIKLGYLGLGLAGKLSNLEVLHQHLDAQDKLLLIKALEGDRLVFLRLVLNNPEVCKAWPGLRLRLWLATASGAVYYQSTRELIWRNVDACVYIPRLTNRCLEDDKALFESFKQFCEEAPRKPALILQHNLRQQPGGLDWDRGAGFIGQELPVFQAVANVNTGVEETLFGALERFFENPLHRVQFLISRLRPFEDLRWPPFENEWGVRFIDPDDCYLL